MGDDIAAEDLVPGKLLSLSTATLETDVMRLALMLAEYAIEKEEVPIAAIIYRTLSSSEEMTEIQILGAAHNRRELDNDPTGHAEMVVMRQAGVFLNNWHLNDCSLFVTLEPCPMCAGAMVNGRLSHLYFGASDQKMGCAGTIYNLVNDDKFNHRLKTVKGGILAEESVALLQRFFKVRR